MKTKEDCPVRRCVTRLSQALTGAVMATLALTVLLAPPLRGQDTKPAVAEPKNVESVAKSYDVVGQEQQTREGVQRQLETLSAKRRALQSEQAYVDAKVAWAKSKLAGRGAPGAKDETSALEADKWTREVKAWEARKVDTLASLATVASEENALMKAVGEDARTRDEKDMVVPGDMLEVSVAEDDSFNGIYQVRAGGYVIIPRLPKINVAGKTLKQVELAIRDELGQNQVRDASVTVDLVVGESPSAPRSYLYLTGEVGNPGPWPIPGNYKPTVVTLMLRVGLTAFADLERVQVLRLADGRALIETINVKAIMDGAGLTPDFALLNEDIVMVPAKATGEWANRSSQSGRIYMQGNVLRPGVVVLPAPARMTVMVAIRQSGGPNRNADLTTLELIRIERDRTRREILNLGAIMRGEQADVNLLSEDILVLWGRDARTVLSPMRVYLDGRVGGGSNSNSNRGGGPVVVTLEDGEDTILQVLMRNGGYGRFADQAGVYVLRDMGNGIRNRIPVDMKKVQKGIIPDLILKDNDIVYVPEKFFSF